MTVRIKDGMRKMLGVFFLYIFFTVELEKLEALGTLCSSQTPLQHRQNMERYDGFIYIIGKDRIG